MFEHRTSFADLEVMALKSPILCGALLAWKSGVFSLEQALISAAACLAYENLKLLKSAEKLAALKIPEPIETDGKKYHYCGPCPLCGQLEPEERAAED
jgi:hypothetical protein